MKTQQRPWGYGLVQNHRRRASAILPTAARKGVLVLVFAVAVTGAVLCQSDQTLAERRTAIDGIDARIVALLNERAGVVREIGRLKHAAGLPASDPQRVEQVLRRIASSSTGPLPAERMRRIYEAIIAEMTAFEAAEMVRQ